jgi:hypothetical protein
MVSPCGTTELELTPSPPRGASQKLQSTGLSSTAANRGSVSSLPPLAAFQPLSMENLAVEMDIIDPVKIVPQSGPQKSTSPSRYRIRRSSGLARSKSSPGLAHKLSTTFLHPTVVHRPSLKSRPSLMLSLQDHAMNPEPESCVVSPDDTTVTSYNTSGSISAKAKNSTAGTSISSGLSSGHSNKQGNSTPQVTRSKSSSALERSRSQSLSPIQETPVVITPCTCYCPTINFHSR